MTHPAPCPARLLPLAAALVAVLLALPAAARAAETVPGEVVVAYEPPAGAARPAAARPRAPEVLRVADVDATIRRLRARPDVRYAVPNVVGHAAAAFMPNDPGAGTTPGGWARLQWNFTGPASVNAPQAWANLIAAGRPGGRGVKVAVLDTGVAYRRFGRTPPSPDLDRRSLLRGYDYVGNDPYPNDRNGHGTHVASTIAEATNNGKALTGLAYGVRIMPVKVLDDEGNGNQATIARGVRYAVDHGAQVINISITFGESVTTADLPTLIEAIDYAHRRGVIVVAAAGNEGRRGVALPARADHVIGVGATTEHGCLADISNYGSGLDLVAPGGGGDAVLTDPGCAPDGPLGRNIAQLTLVGAVHTRFGIPSNYEGTSMATGHVTAAAALVIASGVLGSAPTPAAVERRLERTARDLGPVGRDSRYGSGRVDAGAATDPAVPVT